MQSTVSGLIKILVFACISLSMAACGKGVCIQGTGEVATESRTVPAFTEIALYNRINVILTQDTVNQIQVEAGRHLLSGIETTVNNNVLTISDKNSCNWARDLDNRINVYIHTNSLQKISYYGSGDVTSTNTMTAEKITIDSWEGVGSFKLNMNVVNCDVILRQNNADVTLSGACDSAYVYCGDQGKADLRNLVCRQVWVDHKGIYDTYVYANQGILANIYYKGNVYVRGNPTSKKITTTNSGQLISIP